MQVIDAPANSHYNLSNPDPISNVTQLRLSKITIRSKTIELFWLLSNTQMFISQGTFSPSIFCKKFFCDSKHDNIQYFRFTILIVEKKYCGKYTEIE